MTSSTAQHENPTPASGFAGTKRLTSGERSSDRQPAGPPDATSEDAERSAAPARAALEQLRAAGDGRPFYFVQALLAGPTCSGAEAARIAGYSPKGAKQQAAKLMTRADVRAALAEGRMQIAERFELTKELVTQELAALAKARLDDVVDIDRSTGLVSMKPGARIPDRARRAMKKIKVTTRTIDRGKDLPPIVEQRVEVDMHSKDGALDKLMSHLGLYPVAAQPQIPGNLVVQVVAAFSGSPPVPDPLESVQLPRAEPITVQLPTTEPDKDR